MHDGLQLAIAAMIVVAVMWSVHRHGRGNPEGTGKLSRQIGKLFAEVAAVKANQATSCTKAELDGLEAELKAFEKRAASSGEVVALEGKINVLTMKIDGTHDTLEAKIEAVAKTVDKASDGVSRIEAILMKGALDR